MPRPRLMLVLLAAAAWAHAPLTPALRGPLRTEGARIVDSTGATGRFRGAVLPDLDAATAATLGAMRIRWNFNAVRIPVRVSDWQRDGRAYLDRVGIAVAPARDAEMIVILVAEGEPANGFRAACAAAFRDVLNVVFSLSRRRAATADWPALFDTIRAAGARQIVSAPADTPIRGENVVYEAPVAVGSGNVFGSLLGRVPVYAGEWGLTDCPALPSDPLAVSDLVFKTLYDFDDRGISWTASDFAPESLLRAAIGYEPSAFGSGWRCGQPGMGEAVLTWMSGDPTGFGCLRKDAIASAAGRPVQAPHPPDNCCPFTSSKWVPRRTGLGAWMAPEDCRWNWGEPRCSSMAIPRRYSSPVNTSSTCKRRQRSRRGRKRSSE